MHEISPMRCAADKRFKIVLLCAAECFDRVPMFEVWWLRALIGDMRQKNRNAEVEAAVMCPSCPSIAAIAYELSIAGRTDGVRNMLVWRGPRTKGLN